MKKSKILVSSIMVTLFSTTLLAGATYSLFTSESTHDITVGSATVDVTSSVHKGKLDLYSMGNYRGSGVSTFENGGSATLEANGRDITLNKLTPGDEVRFKISIQNNSTVKVKYRVRISTSNTAYGANLKLNGNSASSWEEVSPSPTPILSDELSLVFDQNANDDYQSKRTVVSILVEVTQANDPTIGLSRIKFNCGESGQTLNDITGKSGDRKKLPSLDPYDHKTFTGWSKPDGTFLEAGSSLVLGDEEEITLTAVFKDIKYNLRFDDTKGVYGNSVAGGWHTKVPYGTNIVSTLDQLILDYKINSPGDQYKGVEVEGYYYNYDADGEYANDDLRFKNKVNPSDTTTDQELKIYVKLKLKQGYHQLKVVKPPYYHTDNAQIDYYLHEDVDLTKNNVISEFIYEHDDESYMDPTFYKEFNKNVAGVYLDPEFKTEFNKTHLTEDTSVYIKLCDNVYNPTYKYAEGVATQDQDSYNNAEGVSLEINTNRIIELGLSKLEMPDFYKNVVVTEVPSFEYRNWGKIEIILPKYATKVGSIISQSITYPANIREIPQGEQMENFVFDNIKFREGLLETINNYNFIKFTQDVIVFPDSLKTIGNQVFRERTTNDPVNLHVFFGSGIESVGEFSLLNQKNIPANSVVNYYFKNYNEALTFHRGKHTANLEGITYNVYAPSLDKDNLVNKVKLSLNSNPENLKATVLGHNLTQTMIDNWGHPENFEKA